MKDADIEAIRAWLVDRGLAGSTELDLLHGFCERCSAAGLPLSRGLAVIDTLHPVYEGRAFRWRNDGVTENSMVEYGRSTTGEAAASWQQSVFNHLLTTGGAELRRRLAFGDEADFSQVIAFKTEGETDYLALIHRFAGDGVIGDMDCVYSHWLTRHPEGFGEEDVAALRQLLPTLALAIKCRSVVRIAGTLVEVYLGRDAGRRVLSGRILRGVADRISAVLWFSDLLHYTAISESEAPDEIIPLLNDYADAVISAVQGHGGDVLKLIGDGVLAIFTADTPAEACRAALAAEAALRRRLEKLDASRRAEGRPVTAVYLGLHVGDVLYGNIGSNDRLDFTVVGPAVNEVNRIASVCRSVDRSVVLSQAFVDAMPPEQHPAVASIGRFALKGVRRAQHLYTLDASA